MGQSVGMPSSVLPCLICRWVPESGAEPTPDDHPARWPRALLARRWVSAGSLCGRSPSAFSLESSQPPPYSSLEKE